MATGPRWTNLKTSVLGIGRLGQYRGDPPKAIPEAAMTLEQFILVLGAGLLLPLLICLVVALSIMLVEIGKAALHGDGVAIFSICFILAIGGVALLGFYDRLEVRLK